VSKTYQNSTVIGCVATVPTLIGNWWQFGQEPARRWDPGHSAGRPRGSTSRAPSQGLRVSQSRGASSGRRQFSRGRRPCSGLRIEILATDMGDSGNVWYRYI